MSEVFCFPAQLDSEFPKDKYLIMFNINPRTSLAKYLECKYLLDEWINEWMSESVLEIRTSPGPATKQQND